MIIERFHPEKVKLLYERFDREGRLLPKGVHYINSWIDETVSTCFQLMEADSLEGIQEWIRHWEDVADFEVIPIISSAEAKAKVFSIK